MHGCRSDIESVKLPQARFICLVVYNQSFRILSYLPWCLPMDQVDKVSFRISEADQVTTARMVDQFFDSTGVRKLQCPASFSIPK